jgi:hypothetical protein
VEPIRVNFAGIDESARFLDVPAIAHLDGLQSGKTRTHHAAAGVLVPPCEAIYGNDGHAKNLRGSELRAHPGGGRHTAKYDQRQGQIQKQITFFDGFFVHGTVLYIVWPARAPSKTSVNQFDSAIFFGRFAVS